MGTTDERKREEMWGRNSQRKGEREREVGVDCIGGVSDEGGEG